MAKQWDEGEKFTRTHRRVGVFVTVGVLAAAGALTAVFLARRNSAPQSTPTYREYTVSKGDVTVGATESGTVSLEDETVAFPVACTVGSVLVKPGQTVKKGDPVIQLDLSSVSDSTSDTRQKLESAKLSLQTAVSDQKAKLETAKITYESSRYLAQSAPAERELTLSELQNSITSAQAALEKDQKDLAAYEALRKSWPADYKKLQSLKKWAEDAKASETNYETQLSDFKSDNSTVLDTYEKLKTARDNARQEYVAAKYSEDETDSEGNDADVLKDAYQDASETAKNYYSEVAGTVVSRQTALEDKVAQYTAEYGNYSAAYSDFKETYDGKYKITGSDLDAKVTELRNSVSSDGYNLKKAKKTAEISSQSAATKEKTDLSTAASAQDTYALTVNKLAQTVDSAQESYDKLQRQLQEIDNALNGNGVLTSPGDGVVASTAVSAGSSVAANETMLTVSTDRSVSLALSVAEDDVIDISVGQEASIALSAYDGQSFDALVDSITAKPARSGASSVTYTVVVKTTGPVSGAGKVYDGMSGEGTVIRKRVKDALYLSNRSVSFRNGISTVLVKSGSGTKSVPVKTGFSNGTNVEILSGLKEGDTVLAESAVSQK